MRRLFLAVAVALSTATAALCEPATVLSRGPATILGGEHMLVRSPSLGREFLIEVMPPHSPKLYATQTFPVIYALDGAYGQIAAVRNLMASGAMANAYVVSVGYRPSDWGRRMDDLMHRPVRFMGRMSGAGGADFERFLIDELRPLLEAQHAVDHRRAIFVGHSATGLFGAKLMANRPGAFHAYVLGSPSFWLEPEAKAPVAAARGSGERVLIAVGGKEEARMTDDAAWLARTLRRGFRPELTTYPGANHNSFYLRMLVDALPALLPTQQDREAPPYRVLSDGELRPYLGKYRLDDGRTLSFRGLDGFLWADLPGVGSAPFVIERPGRFYSVGLDITAAFDAAGVTVGPPGSTWRGTRLASDPAS